MIRVWRRQAELNAVIGQNRMDFVGDEFNESGQEIGSGGAISLATSCAKANFEVRSIATKR